MLLQLSNNELMELTSFQARQVAKNAGATILSLSLTSEIEVTFIYVGF